MQLFLMHFDAVWSQISVKILQNVMFASSHVSGLRVNDERVKGSVPTSADFCV